MMREWGIHSAKKAIQESLVGAEMIREGPAQAGDVSEGHDADIRRWDGRGMDGQGESKLVGPSDGRASHERTGSWSLGIGAFVLVVENYIKLKLSLVAIGCSYLRSRKQKQREPGGPCKFGTSQFQVVRL